jgi:hypothetical protein
MSSTRAAELMPPPNPAFGPKRSFSTGFIVTFILIIPICLIAVNLSFFTAIHKQTYVLQVVIPPSLSTTEIETTRQGWNEVNVNQTLRIRQSEWGRVALDYPYPESDRFIICLIAIVGCLILASFAILKAS